MTKPRELGALTWGTEAGRVRQSGRGRLSFTSDDAWRTRRGAVALSVSMPLVERDHAHDTVEAYRWGLLPDNEVVLDRWGKRFHVSPRSPLALLANVGEECAGAAQFAAPDRLEALQGSGATEVTWFSEAEVADRLRMLKSDQSAWRGAHERGQFSLAGSQPKTALLLHEGRWGVPAGRTPTTHILKPPIAGLDGHVENEHLCLLLARAAGLPTATSEAKRFGDEVAIVVTRYDRVRIGDHAAAAERTDAHTHAAAASGPSKQLGAAASIGAILRVHQEDLCQALRVRPTLKYQSEGGPSPADILDLLREHSSDAETDITTFVDALAFNWLIAGTDAHAKNYSLLLAGGGRVRLAPLYDLGSALPYPGMDPRRIKLAMRIVSEYRVATLRRRHWLDLAESLGRRPETLATRIAAMAHILEAAIPEVLDGALASGLEHAIVMRLAELLAKHVARRSRHLAPL